jgi:2-aminoadipate transaminase
VDARILALHKAAAAREDVLGLAGGLPADELLPQAKLATALAEVAASGADALQYGWPEGDEALRVWIASRLAARGAPVEPRRVIVTAGAQQALALAGESLRGARIAVGDATYPSALSAFVAAGAQVVCDRGAARYAIAGVSNPHGIELASRDELLAGSEVLIVDEAYAELRFDRRTPRPLVGDAPDRVWHIGTISKTLCPGLRVGWLVPPASAHAAVLERKQAADLQTASLSQAALVRLLARVDYDALLDRARQFYAERCERLVDAVRRHLPEVRFAEPEGGFSIWLETDETGDDVALLEAAIANGVSFDPGSAFRHALVDRIAMRLSFSNAPTAKLDEAARRLARTLTRWRRQPRAA